MSNAILAMVLLAPPPPSLAIVCLGDEPASTGDLQDALHSFLDTSAAVAALPPHTLAERLHKAPVVPPRDFEDDRRRLRQLIEQIQAALAFDELAAAQEDLAVAMTLRLRAQPSVGEQAELFLWQALLHTKTHQDEAARASIQQALTYDPSIHIDLSRFSPSFRNQVERERQALGEPVELALDIKPEAARVALDGHPRAAPYVVFRGEHQLEVSAAGFHSVTRSLDANTTIARVRLPLDIGDLRNVVTHALNAPTDSASELALQTLARRAETECMLIASRQGPSAPDRPALFAEAAGEPSLLALRWCDGQTGAATATFADTPLGIARLARWATEPTPEVIVSPPPEQPTTVLRAVGGLGGLWQHRTLATRDGAFGYGVNFLGVGATADIEGSVEAYALRFVAEYADFSASRTRVTWPDGSASELHGGRFIGGALRAQTVTLSGAAWNLALGLGASYVEEIADRTRSDFATSGLFPHSRNVSAQLAADLSYRHSPSAELVVTAVAVPITYRVERPENFSGSWRWAGGYDAGIEWRRGDDWQFMVRATTRGRIALFRGASRMSHYQDLRRLRQGAFDQNLFVGVRYR